MMEERDIVQARAAAVIAASNIISHHDAVGGNPTMMMDRLEEIAEPIFRYILSGNREGIPV